MCPFVPTSSRGGSGGSGLTPIQSFGPIGAPQASFVWPAIPGTSANLLLVGFAATTQAAAGGTLGVQFNGDAAAHYQSQYTLAQAAAIAANTSSGDSSLQMDTSGSGGANGAAFFVFIPGYAGTTFDKGAHMFTGDWPSGLVASFQQRWRYGVWLNSAAITQVALIDASGANLAIGSQATLYTL